MAETCTLTLVYNDDDGTVEKLPFSKGDSISARPYAAKNNYYFEGWTKKNGSATLVNFPFTIEKDVKLYARYLLATNNKLRYTPRTDGKSISVSKNGLCDGDIIIADLFLNMPVIEIEISGFYWRTNMATIRIPESVTIIGEEAFARCVSLRTLILPEKLLNIGKRTFDKCINLQSLTIPSSVSNLNSSICSTTGIKKLVMDGDTYSNTIFENNIAPQTLEEIYLRPGKKTQFTWDRNFRDFAGLRKVNLPVGTVESDISFNRCNKLSEINLPDGFKRGDFSYLPALKTLRFPDSYDHFDERSFYESGIETITIPPKVAQKMHERVFENTLKLAEIKTDDRNPFYFIESDCLCYRENGDTVLYHYPCGNTQESFTIPGKIQVIGSCSFQYAFKLKYLEIEEGVKIIKFKIFHEHFEDQYLIESLTFPESMISIGSGACCCSKLKELTFLRPSSMGVTKLEYSSFCSWQLKNLDKVYVPDEESIKAYTSQEYFPTYLKSKVTTLPKL